MKRTLYLIPLFCLPLVGCEPEMYCRFLQDYFFEFYNLHFPGFDYCVTAYGGEIEEEEDVTGSMACNYRSHFKCDNDDSEEGFCTELLSDASFQLNTYRTGFRPDTAGFWQGDLAEVVTEDDEDARLPEIRPCMDAWMLKFISSTVRGNLGSIAQSHTSTQLQLVDLGFYKSKIQQGDVKVVARALFDRVEGDEQTDRRFTLRVRAYAGTLASFPTQWVDGTQLAVGATALTSDAVTGWQEVVVTLMLPQDTDFVAVELNATEDVFNDALLPEFDGHFVDGVRLEVSR